MKALSSTMLDHLAGDVTTLATCWKLVLANGTIKGFTNHTDNLLIDGVTYEANSGFTPTSVQTKLDLSSDNMDLMGLLDSSGITDSDVLSGQYDYAEVSVFLVNYADTSQGTIPLRTGRLGTITVGDNTYEAEMRGIGQQMQQKIGWFFSVTCRADFGDSDCGIELEPIYWSATVSVAANEARRPTVYGARRYVCTTAGTTGATEPAWTASATVDGSVTWQAYDTYTYEGTYTSALIVSNRPVGEKNFFQGGAITGTSGDNNGLTMEVDSDADGVLTPVQPFPFAWVNGDTFKVIQACNKRTSDCNGFAPENGTRGNIYNFQGEPFIPEEDTIYAAK